jgi:pimeloyl-ACP methyl ester carboxylesterase
MRAQEWRNKGGFVTVFGRKIFVIDTAVNSNSSANNKKTLVLLHGYPTSSYDYYHS